MPEGPFGGPRLTNVGPFSRITFSDFIKASRDRFYDPYEWHRKKPERLYHNTTEENLLDITAIGEFKTDDVFLSAGVGEGLGAYAIVFDGSEAVERGFSPRTYLIGDGEEGEGENIDGRVKTNRGVVYVERFKGCYPKPLWDSYKFQGAGERCNPNYNQPYEVYISPVSSLSLPPYGEFDVDRDRELVIDMGQQKQQTFVLATPEDKFEVGQPEAIIYDSKHGDGSVASRAASFVNSTAISSDEAAEIYPELLSSKPAYLINRERGEM